MENILKYNKAYYTNDVMVLGFIVRTILFFFKSFSKLTNFDQFQNHHEVEAVKTDTKHKIKLTGTNKQQCIHKIVLCYVYCSYINTLGTNSF